MNKRGYFTIVLVLSVLITGVSFIKQPSEPWRPDQLMAPADLAETINHPTGKLPLIISIGPAGLIKGSVETGPAHEKENLAKLKALVSKEKKDREIVIYCGCCPFKNCPNIRPAFSLLNSMHFSNHKLLDLPHNIKVDWIDHDYPKNESK